MRLLYIGDIMGAVGLGLTERLLPALKAERKVDVVIAQAENVTDGRGITVADYRRLLNSGVDFCTGGNWTLYRDEIWPLLDDPSEPIIRPANYPAGTAGLGHKTLKTAFGDILVVSLLGHVVGRDADKPFDNPLQAIDGILGREAAGKSAVVVNLHGDYSSEKFIIGYYLDGRASLVVGDHWHVPTADAEVLPSGTARITDVGMCGSLDSSLGVSFDSVIPRWRDSVQTRNRLEASGRLQFNAVLADISGGRAVSVEQIRLIQSGN